MSSIDPDLIRKYRAILNLATKGATKGERTAAQNAADKLAAKFPGLKEAAAADPRRPDMGDADDPRWTPPPGFGVPGVDVEGWIRETIAGVFASFGRDAKWAKLAKPVKITIATSERGRLEISATLAPSALDAVVDAVEEDDAGIDRWADHVGRAIAADLAAALREALEAREDDEDDYDDEDDD